jgi:hypothetical protein
VRRRLRAAAALAGALGAAGCAAAPAFEESEQAYQPDRRDYFAFRPAWPEILEPNYLPFLVHRFASSDPEGDLLVFCRWDEAAMPLPVFVAAPRIPEALQDEWNPRDPAAYQAAALSALRRWERELEGLVRFRRVELEADARLVVRLLPEQAPAGDPERQPLGATRLAGACRPRGFDPEADRLRVEFAVPELRIYVADEFGLLTADQVEWIALHEVGHALGMRGHSPLPGDLMYEEVRDRVRLPELSIHDVNSFVNLYQIPSGTVFGRLAPGSGGSRDPEPPPPPQPELELAPWVDARRGFELRTPQGWMRFETARGMAAVEGVTWDSSASLQVIVEPHATLEAHLARYGAAYLSHGQVLQFGWIALDGREALHATLESSERGRVEDLVFVESGDGRLLVAIGDCPAEHADAWRPWFWASLATLRIRSFTSREVPPPAPP